MRAVLGAGRLDLLAACEEGIQIRRAFFPVEEKKGFRDFPLGEGYGVLSIICEAALD